MRLAAGQKLKLYEIRAPLGAGAMGEVYRAHDTRLQRDVAIKVLPAEFATDPERLQRFEREARILASLNHTHIAAIHGLELHDGLSFLVLELVPGEDLATRLLRGRLPLDDALDVCRQIADGLEAAHEAGVVHRDLKPANVRITPDGHVKILDFGLARSASAGGAPGHAVTGGLRTSREGVVLGTPVYMSPEQARGRPVDRRTDIWAFGCILFECLSGQPVFAGDSVAELLVAILEKEWDPERLPRATPAHVRRLLERCLDKDPRHRLRDIGEARIALEPGAASGLGHSDGAPPAARLSRALPAAAALVLGAVLAIAVGWTARSAAGPPIRLHRLSEIAGMEQRPAISPDGGKVAFVSRVGGRLQVFLRLLERGAPVQVTTFDADHTFPRWADEDTLLYLRQTARDEQPTLCEFVPQSSLPPRPIRSVSGEVDVSRDGSLLATFVDGDVPSLVLLDRRGKEVRTVARLDPQAKYSSPRWSPDDRHIACEARYILSRGEIHLIDVATGAVTVAADAGQTQGLAWLPDGSGLVYSSSRGSALAYPPVFSLRTVGIDGEDGGPLPLTDTGYASYLQPDIGRARALVACRVALDSDVFRYPVAGTPAANTAAGQRITRQTGLVQVPSASPNDEEVVFLSNSGGHANLWVARTDGTGHPRRITDESDPRTMIGLPVWSPTDDLIVYYRGPVDRDPELWLVHADGRDPRLLVRAGAAATWSEDGRHVYFLRLRSGAARSAPDTYRIAVAGGEPELVRRHATGLSVTDGGKTCYFTPTVDDQGEVWRASPVSTGEPVLVRGDLRSRLPLWPHSYLPSPDGKWLGTSLKDLDTTNLWRISTADGTLHQVTDFGDRATMIGRQIAWSRDGQWIYAAVMETDADIVRLDGALR